MWAVFHRGPPTGGPEGSAGPPNFLKKGRGPQMEMGENRAGPWKLLKTWGGALKFSEKGGGAPKRRGPQTKTSNGSLVTPHCRFYFGISKKVPPSPYFTIIFRFFVWKIVVKFSPLRGEKSSDLEFSGYFIFSKIYFRFFENKIK